MTIETTMISSISFDRSVSTERLIRSDRSYVVTIFTPGGSDGSISFSRAFTRSMTSSAFSPLRITTMPPTASPLPSRSVMPRRISGPSDTRPMSPTVSGVPFLVRLDDDLADVLDRLEVAAAPDHVLAPRELDEAPADLVVALADRLHDGLERQAVRRERVRVQRHLVLLLEAAHARDLRDAGHRLHGVPQEPVLIRADLVGRVLPALVDEGVLVDPADARRVRPELGLHAGGEARLDRRELLEDARARPVDVGPVLEDDVDVREAEVREAPDRLHLRRAEEGRHDRIRDLVLEDVGAPVPARDRR